MKERKPRPLCQSCGKGDAKYIVDIKGAVTMLSYMCTRCMHKTLKRWPSSSAVNLPEYE